MKKTGMAFLLTSTIILYTFTPLSAEELSPVMDKSISYMIFPDNTTFIAQINNDKDDSGKTVSEDSTDDPEINWHKVFGWSTVISGAATLTAIGMGNGGAHCGLAYLSSSLAAATCVTGYYSYSDVLGNDAQYTVHATLGTLATIGFATALALADGGAHAATGAASGVVFIITIGTVYF